jgi:hypothetical protein
VTETVAVEVPMTVTVPDAGADSMTDTGMGAETVAATAAAAAPGPGSARAGRAAGYQPRKCWIPGAQGVVLPEGHIVATVKGEGAADPCGVV